jgi:protocatechuate 3,4-dioxygenase beta subunit
MFQFSTLFLLIALVASTPAEINENNQHEGSIKGVIINEHNTPIENALIYLNKEDKLIKVTTSDTLGNYEFNSVKTGTYSIKVSYVGYFKKEIKSVLVGEGKEELNITMKELRCTHGH